MEDYAEQIHRCFRCGYCKFTHDYSDWNCPSYARFGFDTYSTGGRLWLGHAWLNNEIDWSEHLGEILYACTACKNCVEQCPMRFSSDIVEWIVGIRSAMVDRGKVPEFVTRFLTNVYDYGNPLRMRMVERDNWADGIPRYQPGDAYLLYVGCLGSYDDVARTMARSVADLLAGAGLPFGILGTDEECCGNEVYMLGELALFQELAGKNIRQFKELGVKKVVALSPHAYNVMKNNYSKFGADFEVYHYLQVLDMLMRSGSLKLRGTKARVTYHDPCFLGRYNGMYDIPRRILQSIPGVEMVEMARNRENAFCCGGGSGNFVMDLLSGSTESPSRIRAREAYDIGADVLATACPACMTMLTDAVKVEDLDGKIAVKDISQIVKQALPG
jgi:Fe-S oxidoreductase